MSRYRAIRAEAFHDFHFQTYPAPNFLRGSFNLMAPKLLTLKEFASHLGVSYSTVRRMVADKTVRVVMPHRRAMIPESEVEKFTFPRGSLVDDERAGT